MHSTDSFQRTSSPISHTAASSQKDLKKMAEISWLIVVFLLMVSCPRTLQDCVVSMNGGLPDPEPLVLLPGGSRDVFGFKPPSPGRNLVFSEGEVVRLVCTGQGNFFSSLGPEHRDIAVTCIEGLFQEPHITTPLPFSHFKCSEVAVSTTRKTPALCDHERHRLIEVGYEVSPDEFYWTMAICFDEELLTVVWSRFDLVPSIREGEIGLERPRFDPGPYFQGLDPDRLYTRRLQRDTLTRIIGHEGADIFLPRLPPDTKVYLSRGHLTANADFTYNVLKLSTYYFINAAPQWHTFNDGSWRELETGARYFAHYRQLSLVVFTGVLGVTTLPDKSGAEQELFLDYVTEPEPRRRIPVPAVFWKVVYDPVSQKGIAFVGVNNPHKQLEAIENDPRYQLCENKIDVPFWRMCRAYQPDKQVDGFGYCCEVDDLRRSVTSLPPLQVTGVLA